MKLLTAVFSYNRGQLLANCIKSIELFSPPTQVVIFDDESDEPQTRAVLHGLGSRGYEVITSQTRPPGEFGGLFANMNRALELASEREFDLVHFVQDDTQLVWKSPSLVADIIRITSVFEDACQIMVHFWKRLGITPVTIIHEHSAYALRVVGDLGVFPVERLRTRGFRFRSSEHASTAHAVSLGLRPYAIANPVVARIPWPRRAHRGGATGRDKPGGVELLVKPLEWETIRRLTDRPLEELPYGEDYYVPWGWRCWRPYPISSSYKSWLKGMVVIAMHQRSVEGIIPRRVGERSGGS